MNTTTTRTLALLPLPGDKTCRVVTLTAAHAAAIAALHSGTIQKLKDAEKSFMLDKNTSYFAAHFAQGAGNTVIAVLRQRQLIAQALIRHPTAAYPATGMVDMAAPAPLEKLSIMQAVSVSPAFRGLGLMDAMVKHWVHHAAAHGRTDLLAEIHVDNSASWSCFLRAGLALVGIGYDPDDGVAVYNAHGRTADILSGNTLRGPFNHHACAQNDLLTQSKLMKQGYAVTARDSTTKNLVMTKLMR